MNVYVISLGCQKNRVDTEVLLGNLIGKTDKVVLDINDSDLVLINTCAFIESAKTEAIENILWASENKPKHAKLVVTGCLSTRYNEEIKELLSEVDLFVSIKEYKDIKTLIGNLFNKTISGVYDINNRLLTRPNYSVDVKISEGCNNRCSYCAIPLIRGSFVSRDKESILDEVESLVSSGTKEINLISQDTTNYGYGLYTDYNLVSLLKDIVAIKGDFKVRLLYLYPYLVTDELIDYIASQDKIFPYFDIPIQHINNRMLKLMNRRDSKEGIINLIKRIRTKVPNSILRTTLIVGFPTESEEDFEELLSFIKEYPFDRLGAFAYSQEEGTKGATLDGQIEEDIKQKRLEAIYLAQDEVSLKLNKSHIGEVMDVLVESYDEEEFCYLSRGYGFAPDDVDGYVYLYDQKGLELKPGDIVKAKVIDADINYLVAKVDDGSEE